MRMNGKIDSGTLLAVTTLLTPVFPDLTSEKLVDALKSYSSESTRPVRTLTRRQVADMLKISLPTVNRMLNEGRLRRIKLGDRHNGTVRIDYEDVRRLMT